MAPTLKSDTTPYAISLENMSEYFLCTSFLVQDIFNYTETDKHVLLEQALYELRKKMINGI